MIELYYDFQWLIWFISYVCFFLLFLDSKSVSCKICGDRIEKKNVAEHIKVGRYVID